LSPVGVSGQIAVAALFAIAELVVIHVPLKRDTHTTSFSEVPLTLGLLVLSPTGLVGAGVLGSFVALAARRGQHGVKLAFNGAQVGAQCVVAVLVFRALSGGAAVAAARTFAAGAAGVLVAD